MADGNIIVITVRTELNKATQVNTLDASSALPVSTYVMNVKKLIRVELVKKIDVKIDFHIVSL